LEFNKRFSQAKGAVEKVSHDVWSKETIFVGTALVAVRLKVRTGTSPVPTNSNSSIPGFSTAPKACGYKKPNYDTVSFVERGISKIHRTGGEVTMGFIASLRITASLVIIIS